VTSWPNLPVTIENRIAVRAEFAECFPQLLHYPLASWMVRDTEVDDPASTMFDDEEAV